MPLSNLTIKALTAFSAIPYLHRLQPCLLCGQNPTQQYGVCQLCWHDLPWHMQTVIRHEVTCQVCLDYDFPINTILKQLKDQNALYYLPLLKACLAKAERPKVQAIVPMPMSTEKLIRRGFNQSLLLAQCLSQLWKIPIWQPIARHYTHSQRGLDRLDRINNLQQSFYVLEHKAKYKHILMLDDVITSGASLAMLKQQLQLLGCTHIHALCLCG